MFVAEALFSADYRIILTFRARWHTSMRAVYVVPTVGSAPFRPAACCSHPKAGLQQFVIRIKNKPTQVGRFRRTRFGCRIVEMHLLFRYDS